MADPIKDYLAEIGRRGGSKKSTEKSEAAKANGKKGGRPKASRSPAQRREISRINNGPSNKAPYYASWMCDGGRAKLCVCGCHEGYHNDSGQCLQMSKCKCKGFCQDGEKMYPPNVEADRAGQIQPDQSKSNPIAGSASSDLLGGAK